MKKIITILIVFGLFSCEGHHNCNCQKITQNKSNGDVTICHYDEITGEFETLTINENALAGHQIHPNDILTGGCVPLGVDEFELDNNPCPKGQELICD